MVPGSGIEPLTNGLSIHCSTSELTWYWYAKLLMNFLYIFDSSVCDSQTGRFFYLQLPIGLCTKSNSMYFNMVSATSSQKPRREVLPCPYPWSKDQRFHGLVLPNRIWPDWRPHGWPKTPNAGLVAPMYNRHRTGDDVYLFNNHNSSTFACCCQAFY